MKRIQAPIIGSGTLADPYHVDLPTYKMISSQTDQGIKPPTATAIVDIPDALATNGLPDNAKIASIYANQTWATTPPNIGKPTKVTTPIIGGVRTPSTA